MWIIGATERRRAVFCHIVTAATTRPPATLESIRRFRSINPRVTRVAVAAAAFVGLAIVRTHGISENFWLLADQMRDWAIALRDWRDLPLSGTPTWAGGRTWGPSYYWSLWLIRHAVGPWVHNLPHAGGVGISLLQSAADASLLLAIWRRLGSFPLALAAVLLVATNPLDLAVSATIWNPPLSVVFVKFAIAIALVAGRSIWWGVAATAVAWLGVQAHLFAILVAAPIAAGFVGRELLERRWRCAADVARALLETIAVLEIPYIIDQFRHPGERLAPAALPGLLGQIHLASNTTAFVNVLRGYVTWPWSFSIFMVLVAAAVVVAGLGTRRDPLLASVTVLPLFAAAAALARWQSPIDSYWLLALFVPFVLTVVVALGAAPPKISGPASAIFLVVVIAALPARIYQATLFLRMPQYGAIARGSLDIMRRAPEVAGIDVTFALPWTARSDYIYMTVLGGRIVPTAPYSATIDRDGSVAYRRTAP
jgi:hypothetical protein